MVKHWTKQCCRNHASEYTQTSLEPGGRLDHLMGFQRAMLQYVSRVAATYVHSANKVQQRRKMRICPATKRHQQLTVQQMLE